MKTSLALCASWLLIGILAGSHAFAASGSKQDSPPAENEVPTVAPEEAAPSKAQPAARPQANAAKPTTMPSAKPLEPVPYTGNYVHEWIGFPEITGLDLQTGEPMRVVAEKDYATVAFFIASYDLGSQNLIQEFLKLEKKYASRFTRFVYVFVNDLEKEAVNFMRDNRVEGRTILCDDSTKMRFQFPPLNIPIIYVGDRRGWLALRFPQAKASDIALTDEFLGYLNVL
jgi:hypothetical protein